MTRALALLGIALAATTGCGMHEKSRLADDVRAAHAVDLTYPIDAATPHWPGGDEKPFVTRPVALRERDGYFAQSVTVPEHYGTHLDAPSHFVVDRNAAHEIPAADLVAEAHVLDISERAARDPDAMLEPADIAAHERALGPIPPRSIAVVRTGWSARAGDPARYANRDAQGRMHFPGISAAAARALVERKVVGVAIDTLSIDPGLSEDFAAHKVLGTAGIYVVENLGPNVARLPRRNAVLIVAPLPIRGGSGSPARVLALLPPDG